jgi:hypothetical protein
MLCVGFEPTIPTSERAKTVHALEYSTNVTGQLYLTCAKIFQMFSSSSFEVGQCALNILDPFWRSLFVLPKDISS